MTVEERLEALEKEVQRLKDVQAIKELKSKYFRALDTKNWDELETTMTPNISTAYSNGKLVFHGPKEITNYFKESMPDTEITLHQGHNPVIWFESDTVAYGKWYLQDNLIFAEGNPYCGTQIQGSAIYTDKYVKVDGEWLIEDICACMRNPSSATKRTASGSICSAPRKRKSSRKSKETRFIQAVVHPMYDGLNQNTGQIPANGA
jgi:bile-acid 7alpha-dehydratase